MATVAELDVVFRGKADHLDRDLRTVERKVKTSNDKMNKDIQDALNFGKFVAGLNAVVALTTSAFTAIDFITARIAGNMEVAYKYQQEFEASMRSIPVIGQVFSLGNQLGEAVFKDKADAEGITSESMAAEKRRLQLLKSTEDAQKRIKDLTRETALLGAGDDEARKRLQAGFRLEDATSGLGQLSPEAQEQIKQLAQQRFKLETAAKPEAPRGTVSLSATSIGLGINTRNITPPDKRGQDRTNSLLSTISNLLERSRAATAG